MEEKKKRRRFSKDIRANVIKLVTDGGRSCADVAAEHQIPVTSVYGWVRQHRVDVGPVQEGKITSSERDELTRLRKQSKEQAAELAFLKKTAAYFATLKRSGFGQ